MYVPWRQESQTQPQHLHSLSVWCVRVCKKKVTDFRVYSNLNIYVVSPCHTVHPTHEEMRALSKHSPPLRQAGLVARQRRKMNFRDFNERIPEMQA